MTTRCQIILVRNNDEITSILCTNDGHPPYMMPLLNKYYNSVSKIQSLFALGDIIVLKPKLTPDPNYEHTALNPQDDVTIAYTRDAKRKGHEKNNHLDYAHLRDTMHKNNVEWGYIFIEKENAWFLIDQF